MADEPKRNIEEQLEAWARKRREDAGEPFELHPATRSMLQGEVSRKHRQRGEAGGTASSFWLAGLWPKFALGVFILAALVTLAVFMFPPTGQQSGMQQLAKEASKPDGALPVERDSLDMTSTGSELRQKAAPDEFSTAEDVLKRETRAIAPTQNRFEEVEREAASADSDTTQVSRVAETLPFSAATERTQVETRQPAAETPAIAVAPEPARRMQPARAFTPSPTSALSKPTTSQNPPRLAAANGEANQPVPTSVAPPTAGARGISDSGVTTAAFARLREDAATAQSDQSAEALWRQNAQQFVRTEAVLKNQSVSQTVINLGALRNFELQQNANNLRVIDSDGSVYAGFVQPVGNGGGGGPGTEAALAIQRSGGESTPAARSDAMASNNLPSGRQEYYFNVVGTNRSLQQQLVFTGRLLAPLSDSNTRRFYGGATTSMDTQTAEVPLTIPLQQSQISGRAILGAGNELEVEAVARPE